MALVSRGQQPVVLLDPARGGAESGAHIADRLPEKQVTLDMAGRLASLLRARGFTVALTREADTDVSSDARAALANNLHPVACILLHATASGSGVHLYTSALHQRVPAAGTAVRWDEAQAPYVDRSHVLGEDLKAALNRSRITASLGETWVRPLDNMQCPAIALEVAPEHDGTGAEDTTYQAQISNALANTLLQWRGKAAGLAPAEAQPLPVAAAPAATPKAAGMTPPKGTAQPKTTATSQPNSTGSTQPAAPAARLATPQPARPAAPATPRQQPSPDRSEP